MNRLLEQRFLVRKNLLTLVGMGLFLYFSYHLIQGERSYIRYMSLQKSTQEMAQEAENLKEEREKLEMRVSMLRPGSIDKDLLEERARAVLGFRHEGEKDLIGP
jgi:cell division protein FtsB